MRCAQRGRRGDWPVAMRTLPPPRPFLSLSASLRLVCMHLRMLCFASYSRLPSLPVSSLAVRCASMRGRMAALRCEGVAAPLRLVASRRPDASHAPAHARGGAGQGAFERRTQCTTRGMGGRAMRSQRPHCSLGSAVLTVPAAHVPGSSSSLHCAAAAPFSPLPAPLSAHRAEFARGVPAVESVAPP